MLSKTLNSSVVELELQHTDLSSLICPRSSAQSMAWKRIAGGACVSQFSRSAPLQLHRDAGKVKKPNGLLMAKQKDELKVKKGDGHGLEGRREGAVKRDREWRGKKGDGQCVKAGGRVLSTFRERAEATRTVPIRPAWSSSSTER